MPEQTTTIATFSRVRLTVISSFDIRSPVAGATLTVIHDDGTVAEIGRTDAFGRAEIPADEIRRCRAILVCQRIFNCGAYRRDDLAGYEEKLLALAPATVQ